MASIRELLDDQLTMTRDESTTVLSVKTVQPGQFTGHRRVKRARGNFEKAGLADVVEVRLGDARELARKIEGPVDFLFIDCNYGNYHPCFQGIEKQLAPGAVVVADNVGIGASGMKDYLDHVRSRYRSKTEWFDIDLPWGKRDAMEVTIIEAKGKSGS